MNAPDVPAGETCAFCGADDGLEIDGTPDHGDYVACSDHKECERRFREKRKRFRESQKERG